MCGPKLPASWAERKTLRRNKKCSRSLTFAFVFHPSFFFRKVCCFFIQAFFFFFCISIHLFTRIRSVLINNISIPVRPWLLFFQWRSFSAEEKKSMHFSPSEGLPVALLPTRKLVMDLIIIVTSSLTRKQFHLSGSPDLFTFCYEKAISESQ